MIPEASLIRGSCSYEKEINMSNMWNEEILMRYWEEAYEELIANGMSKGEAEHAATDMALAKYEEGD